LDLEKGGHNKKRLSYSSAVIMEHKTQICGWMTCPKHSSFVWYKTIGFLAVSKFGWGFKTQFDVLPLEDVPQERFWKINPFDPYLSSLHQGSLGSRGPILVAAQSTEPSISGLLSRCIQTPWQGKDALVGAWDAGPIPSTL
jgi:hypothetical protein